MAHSQLQINWAEPVSSFVREKRFWLFSGDDTTPFPSLTVPKNLTGKGVVVAILVTFCYLWGNKNIQDDGVDYSHPALYQTFHPEHSFDFVRDSSDPFPDDSSDNKYLLLM